YVISGLTAGSLAIAAAALATRQNPRAALSLPIAAAFVATGAVAAALGLDSGARGTGSGLHSMPTVVGLLLLAVGLAARGFAYLHEISLRVALGGLVIGALVPALLLVASNARQVAQQRLAEIEMRSSDITA